MSETTRDSLLGGQVSLVQPAKGHRAGTDAVLLAAAAPVKPGDVVIDVGASTGAAGLMVAARERDARFVFVERDAGLAELCRHNCELNAIHGEVAAADILDKASRAAAGLAPECADLVLTNPPFGTKGAGQAPNRDDFTIRIQRFRTDGGGKAESHCAACRRDHQRILR